MVGRAHSHFENGARNTNLPGYVILQPGAQRARRHSLWTAPESVIFVTDLGQLVLPVIYFLPGRPRGFTASMNAPINKLPREIARLNDLPALRARAS